MTFLRTKDGVEHIRSESLPLGVIQRQQSEKETRQLESGDVVVMVSDGILDALPAGEQEHLLDLMIGEVRWRIRRNWRIIFWIRCWSWRPEKQEMI